MQAVADDDDVVTLSMSLAELVALREAVAFADFSGDLPARSEGEVAAIGGFLRAVDPLIPGLGTDAYDDAVNSAWRDLGSA